MSLFLILYSQGVISAVDESYQTQDTQCQETPAVTG